MIAISKMTLKKRTRSVVWFGRVSYRKMKITYEKKAVCCPLCGNELEDARYYGSAVIQLDSRKLDYRVKFWMPLYEDGILVWQISPKKNIGKIL
jgi:hypothetical protein